MPGPVRGARRATRATAVRTMNAATRPLRRSLAGGGAPWLARVPSPVRRALDLQGGEVSPLRVEVGAGRFPTPGYVHVDHDHRARHLEHLAPVWDLPFADAEVDEILAVHTLEHVHPARLGETLSEWLRVLVPGGTIRVHVPNGPAVFDAFCRGSVAEKWALMNAFFGYASGPEVTGPEQLGAPGEPPDHKAIYDYQLLESVLAGAGFFAIEDLSTVVVDRHTEAWREIVSPMSLVVRARRPLVNDLQ